MDQYLFIGETVISRSADDLVVLTSHRIRQANEGRKHITSVMLDNIDAIELKSYSSPWLMVVAITCAVIAVISMGEPSLRPFIFVGIITVVICLIAFFRLRRHVITIRSSSVSIVFQTRGMKEDKVLEFINKVEEARLYFLQESLLSRAVKH